MTVNEMIKKFCISKAVRNGVVGISIPFAKPTKKDIEMLKAAKPEILAELDRREEEKETKRLAKEAEKEAARQRILSSEDKIELFFYEGEILSGYIPKGEASALLIKLGVAKDIEGWGTIVDSKLVRELGTEFTYQQVLEYIRPAQEEIEKEAEEKKAAKQAKFEEAKTTGEAVELDRYLMPCNDPREECSTDIVIIYAMPDGTTKTVRNHTW